MPDEPVEEETLGFQQLKDAGGFELLPEEVGHGPKRLMGNDLLITCAFSLTR